jgi:hypothetical protein
MDAEQINQISNFARADLSARTLELTGVSLTTMPKPNV